MTRGLATEAIKFSALLAGLVLAANFHEPLASLVRLLRAQMADDLFPLLSVTTVLVPAYLLILVSCLYLGRVVHHLLIVKLMKRQEPDSWFERVAGVLLGVARGWIVLGAALLALELLPLDRVSQYVRSSVHDRSVTGSTVVGTTRLVVEQIANAAPGHELRSELFPFAS